MTVERAINDYVRSRHSAHVSTALAVRALRLVVPHCGLDDRQLADLVAARAIASGYAVSFDHDGQSG